MRFVHKIRIVTTIVLMAGALPCHADGNDGEDVPADKTPVETPAETPAGTPPEGFVDLLPHGSLAYWQGRFVNPPAEKRMIQLRRRRLQWLADRDMTVHWRSCKGELAYDGRGKNIRTVKEYRDFELYLDWKIGQGANATVYLRSTPAVKIWDTSLERLGAEVGSGGLYFKRAGSSKPLVKADRPVGEWNQFRIKMVGDRVTVWLNDQMVVDNEILENPWVRGAAVFPQGHIELEGARSALQIRNIYVRELP
jgi:hypothetical protein